MNRLNGMQGSEAQLKVLVDRLALVKDRALAFALARQNDMAPVNVH